MSDSELSEASRMSAPPDAELEKSLRREVIKASRAGDEFTLRSIRTASETKLGLRPGFYKSHELWNSRSKEVVKEQIELQDTDASSPVKPQRETKADASQPEKKGLKEQTKKRASQGEDPAPRKKSKKVEDASSEELSSVPSDLGSEEELESSAPKRPNKTAKPTRADPKPKPKPQPRQQGSKIVEDAVDSGGEAKEHLGPEERDDVSESDMSVVRDEEPKTKKRKSTSVSGTKAKTPAMKSKPDNREDPDQAEIKRLQGYLVKCGIRKLWGKELKPYETPKAKIKHLKDMLSDAGMTGRYSLEKASQIREARELAADIEAVQEGAEKWGTGEDGPDEGEDSRPTRRLVRGAKNYDFLSSDGEETD